MGHTLQPDQYFYLYVIFAALITIPMLIAGFDDWRDDKFRISKK